MVDVTVNFAGPNALAAFRAERMLRRLSAGAPVLAVYAQYRHFVKLRQPLNRDEEGVLASLLDYGAPSPPEGETSEEFLVVPRLGTISEWSSKATDIAQRCGLTSIARLERGVLWRLTAARPLSAEERAGIELLIHDRMTESVLPSSADGASLWTPTEPAQGSTIDVLGAGLDALVRADKEFGLALSDDERHYLLTTFVDMGRNPTDAELMMFAQANSEHCRHKIFNADFVIDGKSCERTLFAMIRETAKASPEGLLSAYADNAAVMEGASSGSRLLVDVDTRRYFSIEEPVHLLAKVETHNHPTAISPYPGAATGAGGEIRDEGATGRGGHPKAGLSGFSVGDLRLPDAIRPWEVDRGAPPRLASALDIMLEAPVGAAAFNNEFGRPAILGYFRCFELAVGDSVYGYRKPIMLAGGVGSVRPGHVEKEKLPPGTPLVVLGGPALLIGLGGGAASSVGSGSGEEDLDFASVQRGNAEMQRRAQEVIESCIAAGAESPILSIHDVGAGGLSNALPELVHGAGCGADIDLRAIPNGQPQMSPMQIWCNEAQERYVLGVREDALARFLEICERERCPVAVVGRVVAEPRLRVHDEHFAVAGGAYPVDLPLAVFLGDPPRMKRQARTVRRSAQALATRSLDIHEAVHRVLTLPGVASKEFLITIGDRSISGLVCRDQTVGPWQVPVADVGVTATGYSDVTGEALAIGERSPIAVIDAPASARMAIGEAVTNIAAARIRRLRDVRLSANWMASAGTEGEDAALFRAVEAVGLHLCPALGIAIPVGKDSLSMRAQWTVEGLKREVQAPVSLVVTAFAPVSDARKTLTPQCVLEGETDLLLVDFGQGKDRLGGSALAQVYGIDGGRPPDLDDARVLKLFFGVVQALNELGLLLSYHDRSDGGLFVTLCEMAFAAKCGLDVDLTALGLDPMAALFSEELGAVMQVPRASRAGILGALKQKGLLRYTKVIGTVRPGQEITIRYCGRILLEGDRMAYERLWAETSFRLQALRDEPRSAAESYATLSDAMDPGLSVHTTFAVEEPLAPQLMLSKPRVAILREQGVNGQREMAAAFMAAGFEAIDVTMSDLLAERDDLATFTGFAACGGFSFGDVLGAGGGWAKSILFNESLRAQFAAFFMRKETFALGVCNGCQMMSHLRSVIPGAELWPTFERNRSEQFESRTVLVEIPPNPSVLLAGMAGSRLPVPVAHGEGRLILDQSTWQSLEQNGLVAARYIDHYGQPTEAYPRNPNGSTAGITGLTTPDGRFTALMPHPERVVRTVANSWHPPTWGEYGPWFEIFRNARRFVG
ncbi:MAG TPA: phosphoribosylformylglycinamidine synthase [Acidiferrobacter sp.]|nr:phosphoribosylformylglycinamidine synthase [Acidiferrobacter sp.]